MGRITSESHQNETTATHFSHQHPLNLTSHQTSPNSSCSACKLKLSGMVFSCTLCNFFLHKNCFRMPQKITHPFHKAHVFDLLPAPAYDGGVFTCDACGEAGHGFSYHCKPCGIDLHILCAAAPLFLTATCHHHKLELTFVSPYDTKTFACDVCGVHGSDHWLYRCKGCGFDAHLKCARAAPPLQAAAAPVAPPVLGVPGMTLQNEVALQAIVQMIQNNNAMVQAMMAGGGGGFGGDRGVQQIMQLVSFMNRNGGGIPGLDIFGGGGLDSLLGGGGLDFLVGGGLDFLGGLGGLF